MYLRSLRHLYLLGCPLMEMPPNIGQLTNLKTLNTFVVGKSPASSLLAELKWLNLGGQLCIEHLERVSNPMDAKEANLEGKQNLSQLQLKWEYGLAKCESQKKFESQPESESENVDSESESVDSEARGNVESESESFDSEARGNVESEAQENVLPCSWVMMAAASIEVAVASDALLVGRFWAVYGSKVI
ncbi:putative disease resistance protein RGA3 [Camellia lanceoleosa]|nr:putative disease resistance protein RGA3 [Camellia lanceoleosa]